MLIKETQNYTLYVKESKQGEYRIRNKETGVVEFKGQLLPEMLYTIDALQADLIKIQSGEIAVEPEQPNEVH